jgi:hypothetical protein
VLGYGMRVTHKLLQGGKGPNVFGIVGQVGDTRNSR